MNITELYKAGVSTTKFHVVTNPLRRILFRLLRPYFDKIIGIGECRKETEAMSPSINAIESAVKSVAANKKDIEAMSFRFNTIEFKLLDHFAQLCDLRATQRVSTSSELSLVNTNFGILITKPGEIISESIMAGDVWDSHIIELASNVAEKRKGCAIDVGAHLGSMTLAFSRLFEHVYSFEPNDYNFRVLCANVALNGLENVVTLNNCLYSHAAVLSIGNNSQQEIDLPLNDDGEFDGGAAKNLGAYLFSESGSGMFSHAARTLDSYQLNDVAFIKIDVQGADGEVLMGALDTISRCRPVIVFEWEDHLSENFAVSFDQLKSVMSDLRYELSPLKMHNEKQIDYVCHPQ